MKRIMEIIGGIALASMVACASNPLMVEIDPAATASIDVRAEVGNRFQLRAGEVAEIGDDFRVAFRGVSADSRCPEGVTCVWAGDAVLHLGYSTDRSEWSWGTLHTGVEPTSARHGAFTITVLGLSPAARQDRQIEPRDYVAEFRVDRT